MPEIKGDSHFKFMSLVLWLRDVLSSPKKKLEKAGLKPGEHVLDFGCGPGSFSLVAASIVGPSGKVHALDLHPLALQSVERKSRKIGLQNIETISSDRKTGLADQSLDFVILNDVLHELDDTSGVLTELHRALKPEGTLFFSDHHLNEKDALTTLTKEGLFRFLRNSYKSHLFSVRHPRESGIRGTSKVKSRHPRESGDPGLFPRKRETR